MKEKIKEFFGKKGVRIVLVLLIALALLLAVWKVFFPRSEETSYRATEEETRLSALLSQIDGVEEASVMIDEREGTAVGAVVVFRGEDGILVRSRLIEAAARALGIESRDVLVYPSNRN